MVRFFWFQDEYHIYYDGKYFGVVRRDLDKTWEVSVKWKKHAVCFRGIASRYDATKTALSFFGLRTDDIPNCNRKGN